MKRDYVAKTAPARGSFPIDRIGACADLATKYNECLSTNCFEASFCRQICKRYLQCRMQNNLMTPEEWRFLGLQEFSDSNRDSYGNEFIQY